MPQSVAISSKKVTQGRVSRVCSIAPAPGHRARRSESGATVAIRSRRRYGGRCQDAVRRTARGPNVAPRLRLPRRRSLTSGCHRAGLPWPALLRAFFLGAKAMSVPGCRELGAPTALDRARSAPLRLAAAGQSGALAARADSRAGGGRWNAASRGLSSRRWSAWFSRTRRRVTPWVVRSLPSAPLV